MIQRVAEQGAPYSVSNTLIPKQSRNNDIVTGFELEAWKLIRGWGFLADLEHAHRAVRVGSKQVSS